MAYDIGNDNSTFLFIFLVSWSTFCLKILDDDLAALSSFEKL